MTRLTDETLTAICQRVDKFTNGPRYYDSVDNFANSARQDIPMLLAEVEALRDALQFYANEDNHEYEAAYGKASVMESEVMEDYGKIARQALNGGATE
jgi:hypothetical protein